MQLLDPLLLCSQLLILVLQLGFHICNLLLPLLKLLQLQACTDSCVTASPQNGNVSVANAVSTLPEMTVKKHATLIWHGAHRACNNVPA